MCSPTAATVEGTSDKPGYLPGYGALPAPMVTELAKRAKLRPVVVPKDLVAEPRYRPSAASARFIRCRDLTCRFPGCDHPAVACDIDHTVPYPVGPTHPSNNKLYCRRTITEMNFGDGATKANEYHTTGFNKFQTRTVKDVPGVSYILMP